MTESQYDASKKRHMNIFQALQDSAAIYCPKHYSILPEHFPDKKAPDMRTGPEAIYNKHSKAVA